MRRPGLCVLLVAGLASGPALLADCDDDPRNLLALHNCGFDAGIAGWTRVDGNPLVWEPGDGDPVSGSLKIGDSVPAGTGFSGGARSACVAVTGGVTYRWGARYRSLADPTEVSCWLRARYYANTTCAGMGSQGQTVVFNLGGSWTHVADDTTPVASVQAAQVHTLCWTQNEEFEALVDNVFYGIDIDTPVQLQSFSVE